METLLNALADFMKRRKMRGSGSIGLLKQKLEDFNEQDILREVEQTQEDLALTDSQRCDTLKVLLWEQESEEEE